MSENLTRFKRSGINITLVRFKDRIRRFGEIKASIDSDRNPALEGMRGILVVMVALFGTGLSQLSGMFVWVDGFFVMSGYLITDMLIRELNSTGGIQLTKFWSRRAKRILPPLFTMVFIYAVAEIIFGSSHEMSSIRGDILAAIFGITNWYIYFTRLGLVNHIQEYGLVNGQLVLKNIHFYTATDGNSGLLNLWILSIIEQFYIIWPIVVMLLYKWLKSYKLLFRISIFLAILSLARMFAAFNHGANFNGGYYLTDSRSGALMLGAALAFVLSRPAEVPKYIRSFLDATFPYIFVATLIISAAAIRYSNWVLSGGIAAFDIACCLIIAFGVLCPKSEFMPIVTHPVFRILGKLSYGLFLWQYPVNIALTHSLTGLGALPLYILRTVVTLILGTISYIFIERPIISGKYFIHFSPLKLGLASLSTVVILGVSIGFITPVGSATQQGIQNDSSVSALLARDPIRILIVGDSVAYSLAVGLQQIEQQYGVLVDNVALGSCSVIPSDANNVQKTNNANCANWDSIFTGAVNSFSPDVVVIFLGGASLVSNEWLTGWNEIGHSNYDSYLKNSLKLLGNQFISQRLPVILCTAPYFGTHSGNIDPANIAPPSKVNLYNNMLKEIAATDRSNYTLFNLNGAVSPGNNYMSSVNGNQIRSSDGILFSQPTGGEFVAPQLFGLAVPLGFSYRQSYYVPPIVINRG